MSFSLVTLNLLNKPSRWHERRVLVLEALRALNPDVIALQEVALPHNNARWLAEQLGGYTVHTSPKTGALAEHEAVATLSRFPIETVQTLALGSQSRVAQVVKLRMEDRLVALANGHFMFHVYDHIKRTQQVQRVLTWLRLAAGPLPMIACGDFNATPDMRTIQVIKQSFTSAHEAAHGHEPEFTCPTPLVYQFDSVRKGLSRLGNFFLSRRTEPWRGTLDYIFVDDNFRVVGCDVVLDQPALHDPTLYPSDHVGLIARLRFEQNEL
jgi:endonuclease/exonuclease/phosphatase family metal-dependent hydrolase